MIVKVQLSIADTHDEQQVLIYTKGHLNWYQGPVNPGIKKLMKGELRKFFYALVPYTSGQIDLLEEAPEQNW